MTPDKAAEAVFAFFTYKAEHPADHWRPVTRDKPEGDCEDLCLGIIRMATCCLLSFWLHLLFGRYRIWGCTVGEWGHAVLEDQRTGRFIDTKSRGWVSRADMEALNRVLVAPFSRRYVFRKVVFG